jgi:hypothetical protein
MDQSAPHENWWENAVHQVEKELLREFRGTYPLEVIEAVARESVAELAADDLRIRTFVPVLARRAARRRLKESEQRAS